MEAKKYSPQLELASILQLINPNNRPNNIVVGEWDNGKCYIAHRTPLEILVCLKSEKTETFYTIDSLKMNVTKKETCNPDDDIENGTIDTETTSDNLTVELYNALATFKALAN